MVALKKAG